MDLHRKRLLHFNSERQQSRTNLLQSGPVKAIWTAPEGGGLWIYGRWHATFSQEARKWKRDLDGGETILEENENIG